MGWLLNMRWNFVLTISVCSKLPWFVQLTAPEKVHIPERYVPDSSDEEEVLSPTEMQKRAEKAEQIRKMVATQR